MAIYDVTQSPYNAVSDYNPGGAGNTDNGPKIGAAIAAAKSAGGGTVYIPGGGTGYLLSSRYNSTTFPNSIFPVIDVGNIRVVGDAVGRGGSILVKNVDYDTFRIGKGPPAGGGGWAGGTFPADIPKYLEISGLTIRPAKGFYATSTEVLVYNFDMMHFHHFNITDYGWVTGPNGQTFAIYPSGSGSLTGLYYAKVPRPGVTSDPRGGAGSGWLSADMGRLCVGFKFHGKWNYNHEVYQGVIDGTVGGIEFGEYDNDHDTQQGINVHDVGIWRYHSYGVTWFNGDGSAGCTRVHCSQGKGPGFQYMPPSTPFAGGGAGYGMALNECGIDYVGDHCIWVNDVTGGGQKVDVSIINSYVCGAGVSDAAPTAGWPNYEPGKKGIMLQNNRVNSLVLKGNTVILNASDGAEITCALPSIVWDNEFRGNGYDNNPASGLYINNNSLNLNVQRNRFLGNGIGGTIIQDYGMYVNNTNISIDLYNCNQAVLNGTAQTNLGGMGVPVPGVQVGNV